MNKLLSLNRGHYLGKVVDICYADGVIAGLTTYPQKNLTNQMHYHENLHISFVLQGGSFERRNRNEYERLIGNIMLYHAGEAHKNIQKLFPSKNMNLELENDFLAKHAISEQTIESALLYRPEGKILMLKMYKELLESDAFSCTSINMLVLDLISRVAKANYKKEAPSWLKTIHELLNDLWNENLTLTDLSKAATVHPITISKNFHRYFYCTFGEYMRKLRIEKSLALINETSLSLTKISYACNFADQSHFTRTFKELTGFLPFEYKKLMIS